MNTIQVLWRDLTDLDLAIYIAKAVFGWAIVSVVTGEQINRYTFSDASETGLRIIREFDERSAWAEFLEGSRYDNDSEVAMQLPCGRRYRSCRPKLRMSKCSQLAASCLCPVPKVTPLKVKPGRKGLPCSAFCGGPIA